MNARPKKLFIATSNPGKLREIMPLARKLLGDIPMEGLPPPLDEETGATFLENAWLKAYALHEALQARGERGYAVIADDSGLSVDALQGRPGVYSARYAGDHVPPSEHIKKLLHELGAVTQKLEERTAHYTCALALLISEEPPREFAAVGECHGQIGFDPQGPSGFGYDPVFIVPTYGRTYGELSDEIKNATSHRTDAFQKLAREMNLPWSL